MKVIAALLLVFSIGCASYKEYDENGPRKNCASDKDNKSVICDLRVRLYSDDKWAAHSFFVIEKYSRTDPQKTNYQLILRLSLNNAADFETAVFTINGKTHTLKAGRVIHDETYGFREVIYFDIGMDLIKTLSGGKDISLIIFGKVKKEYHIDEEDIPSIQEFCKNL
jgi:hypothetical protein